MSHNIIRANVSGTAHDIFGIWSYLFASGTRVARIWDNVIYDFKNGSQPIRGIWLGGGNNYVYNNTIYNSDSCFFTGISSPENAFKNNIAQGCNTCYTLNSGGWDASSDYNISNDDTAPGAHSKKSTTVAFVDAPSGDFHLAAGDTAAKKAGENLFEDPGLAFSDDIDGEGRAAPWSIGADGGLYQGKIRNVKLRAVKFR